VAQLELERLLQDPLVDPVAERAAEELATQGEEAPGRHLRRHEQELDRDEPQDALAVPG
jgi:hypothetical protein